MVRISRPFFIGVHEVTVGQFAQVMNPEKESPENSKLPAMAVSWNDAVDFCDRLTQLPDEAQHGRRYRLPTEAEWEYAARSGAKDDIWSGTSNEGELGDYAWFIDNTDKMIMASKTKRPNALGLYDMSGNVWEWVEDYFDFEYYQASPRKDPYGPDYSLFKVVRGGSFFDPPNKLRTSYRYGLEPVSKAISVGFRLAE